jgi:hypothetical protein
MKFHRSRLDKVEQRLNLSDDEKADPTPLIERVNCLVHGISDPLPYEFRPVYKPEDSFQTKFQLFFDAAKDWQRLLGDDVTHLDDMVVMKTEYPEGETVQDRIERANRLLEGIGQERTRPKQRTADKPTLKVVT